MRVPPLQHVIARPHRKDQRAFLLHHGNALRARARLEFAGFEAIELDAAGKRRDGARNQLQQRGFSAGIGPEDGNQLALARLK